MHHPSTHPPAALRAISLLLLVLIVTTACGNRAVPFVPKVYRGIYQQGFEVSSFSPCGSSERWWLEGVGGRLPEGESFVVIRARVSTRGAYGHMGGYTRRAMLTRVISANRSGRCQ